MLKYKIMKLLEFDDYVSLEDLNEQLDVDITKFGEAVDSLGRNGYITHNENGDIALYSLSSYRQYISDMKENIFTFTVSLSAIIVAITEVISLIVEIMRL